MTELEKLKDDYRKADDALAAAYAARDEALEAYLNKYNKNSIMKQRSKQ